MSCRAGRSLAVTLSAFVLASCGFLPISRTSLTGTQSLEAAPRPAPLDSAFDGCGEAGSQPDYALNRLKNRVDDGMYLPVPWTTIARLPWPRLVGYRFRNQWTRRETQQVQRFERAAVEAEGYLASYKREIPEPPNCYSTRADDKDFHLWLSQRAHQDKRASIVVEITPRVRVAHPGWTAARLDDLVASQVRIRVRGWLLLDQMHPENVGRNRVTLWEVHPIMQIEWQSPLRGWVSLDSLEPPVDGGL